MFSFFRSFIFFIIILHATSGQGTNDEVPKLPQLQDEKMAVGDGVRPETVSESETKKLSYRGSRSFNCVQCYSTNNRDETHPSSIGHRRRSNREDMLPPMSFSRISGGGGGGGGGSKGGGGGSKGGGGSSKGGGNGGKKSGGKTSTGTGTSSNSAHQSSSGDHNKASHYLFPFFMTSLLMLGLSNWS